VLNAFYTRFLENENELFSEYVFYDYNSLNNLDTKISLR